MFLKYFIKGNSKNIIKKSFTTKRIDYYEILEIEKNASLIDIKKAYYEKGIKK